MMIQLPNEVYKEIGRIVAESAEIDWVMARITAALIGGRAPWSIVAAGQSYSQLDQMLREICKLMEADYDKTLVDLLNRLKPLHQRRDTVAHGAWLTVDIQAYIEGRDSDIHMAVRPRRWKDAMSGENFTVESLRKLADDLSMIGTQLRKYESDYVEFVRWKELPAEFTSSD